MPVSLFRRYPKINAGAFLTLVPLFLAQSKALGQEPEIEVLKAISVNQKGIVITVRTGGCTDRSDFEFEFLENDQGLEIAIVRKTKDYCKGYFPKGVQYSFSWEETGLNDDSSEVRIINPISMGAR